MSAGLYDDVIVRNTRSLFKDNVYINSPDEVFMTIARLEKDTVKLPLISIQRTGFTILDKNHTMKFEGMLAARSDDGKIYNVQAIPIRINYLMDVWSKSRAENDNLLRELIFYYSTNPTLSIKIPYGLDIPHDFNIFFDDDVEDNSDIASQRELGVYFRQTIPFYVPDAYLWKSSSRYPVSIDITITTEEESEDVVDFDPSI